MFQWLISLCQANALLFLVLIMTPEPNKTPLLILPYPHNCGILKAFYLSDFNLVLNQSCVHTSSLFHHPLFEHVLQPHRLEYNHSNVSSFKMSHNYAIIITK